MATLPPRAPLPSSPHFALSPRSERLFGTAAAPSEALVDLPSPAEQSGEDADAEDSEQELPAPAPRVAGFGFKLNLSAVVANQVDEVKPEAIPHTPKGDILERLKQQQQH